MGDRNLGPGVYAVKVNGQQKQEKTHGKVHSERPQLGRSVVTSARGLAAR